MASVSPVRSKRGLFIATGIVVLFALALRCGMWVTLYDGDTELFVYMGKQAVMGGRIGYEIIDNKLPTVSLVMWLPYMLFGSWWTGYWLLSVILAVISVLAVVRSATLVYPESKWPTLAVAATWMSFPMAVFCAFKFEHIQLFTAAVCGWAFIKCWQQHRLRDAFLIGLLSGIGACAKPNALSVFAAAGIAITFWQSVPIAKRAKLLAAMVGGLLVPVAGVLIYLYATGTLLTFPDTYEQIRSYNVNTVFDPNTLVWKIVFVIFLIGTPLMMRWLLERRDRQPAVKGHYELMFFAALWLAIESVGVVMQGRMYGYHFLPLSAPAALMFGLIPRRASGLKVIGTCLPVMLFAGYWFFFFSASTKPPYERMAAVNYVKNHAAPHDKLWLDQYARALVETDLEPGSAVPLTFIFSNDDTAPTRFSAMICSDLRQRHTRWVILPTDCIAHAEKWRALRSEFSDRPARGLAYVKAWTQMQDFVKSSYAQVATFGDYSVYERREAVARVD